MSNQRQKRCGWVHAATLSFQFWQMSVSMTRGCPKFSGLILCNNNVPPSLSRQDCHFSSFFIMLASIYTFTCLDSCLPRPCLHPHGDYGNQLLILVIAPCIFELSTLFKGTNLKFTARIFSFFVSFLSWTGTCFTSQAKHENGHNGAGTWIFCFFLCGMNQDLFWRVFSVYCS